MLIQTILFLILSLILTFIIIILNPQTPKAKLSKTIYRLLLSTILYLIITYFLAGFYDFNPLEVDKVTGIMINPYVALVSLILQFLNIFLLADTWYKALANQAHSKMFLVISTLAFHTIIFFGNIFLKNGYTGTDGLTLYTNLKFIEKLSQIIIYIPFLIYDLNLLSLINIILKRRKTNDTSKA